MEQEDVFIHFSYSRQAVVLTYDDRARRLFSFAHKLGEAFSKRKDARDVAWRVKPLILQEWDVALKALTDMAASGKNSAQVSPWALHCALNLLCIAGLNSTEPSMRIFLLLKTFTTFTPCLVTTRALPPLVEIADAGEFSPLATAIYQALKGPGSVIPIPVDSALVLERALSSHASDHPEISRLLTELAANTKGIRTAFAILKDKA